MAAVGGRILLANRYVCAYDPALCAHGLVVPETSDGRPTPVSCLLVPSRTPSLCPVACRATWQGYFAFCANYLRHRGQQGGRRSSLTLSPSSWRAQASPTRSEQPSLASVGSGMAAGAAFGQRGVRDVGAVQTSFNQMLTKCVTLMYI